MSNCKEMLDSSDEATAGSAKAKIISFTEEDGPEIECDLCDGTGHVQAERFCNGGKGEMPTVECPKCVAATEQSCFAELVKTNATLEAENARLRKQLGGIWETADGKVIHRDMPVYAIAYGGEIEECGISEPRADCFGADKISYCYSTQEAAEAAAGGAE